MTDVVSLDEWGAERLGDLCTLLERVAVATERIAVAAERIVALSEPMVIRVEQTETEH